MRNSIKNLIILYIMLMALPLYAQVKSETLQAREKMAAYEADLAAARARLEQAAREVAELSGRVNSDNPVYFYRSFNPGEKRAMLGINIGALRDDGNVDGVEILGVSPGSPADEAGLKAGDVLLSIDGESLAGSNSRESSKKLLNRMGEIEPGAEVTVEYIRDGKTAKAEIKTVAMGLFMRGFMPGPDMQAFDLQNVFPVKPGSIFAETLMRRWGALELVELTPTLGKYFGTEEGVLVISAPEDKSLKLEDGDVILSIDSRRPNDPNHALRILRSYAPGESLTIEIMRDKRRRKLDIAMPEDNHDDTAFHVIPQSRRDVVRVIPGTPPRPVIITKPKPGTGI